MQDLDMKKKVLQEVMDLMDKKDGEKLQRHPKLVGPKLLAAKVEVEDGNPLKVGEPDARVLSDGKGMDDVEMEKKEQGEGDEELSPEMIKKLLAMVQDE